MGHDRHLTCEQLVDTLDAYLDRTDGPAARARVETHLATCASCPALVVDVRAIRQAARALGPIEPPAHVWHQVRARVSAEAPPRASLLDRLGLSFSGRWGALQPVAAAAGLVLVISSLVWIGGRLTGAPPSEQVADGAGAFAEFQLAEAEYSDAIASLEEAAAAAAPRLDALTNATLRSSIDDIDLAIGDAREALAREPGDALTQESLLDALGSKVALLQDTVALGDLEPATEVQTP
jgi:anti-sigma factor RsiW